MGSYSSLLLLWLSNHNIKLAINLLYLYIHCEITVNSGL